MESITKSADGAAWVAPYARIRADCYAVLACLLGRPPAENLLKVLQNLQWEESIPEGMARALEDLRLASHDYSLNALEDEYSKLFVGLGSGEIVPYASWYREKKLQSTPLAFLRSDLLRLGMVRQADSRESEDHAGALCEGMALISQKPNERDGATQSRFFQQHLAPWMMTFFKDLESAQSARFYRTVGLFGRRFLEAEIEYLK
jgi:TorA maturation chaperone TorD